MRLGQLARILDVKADDIREYVLSEHSEELGEGPNAKIEDKYVEGIEAHFKPVVEETSELAVEETTDSSDSKDESEKPKEAEPEPVASSRGLAARGRPGP